MIVGVCFGELSAAAVSSANSLLDLIPLAIDVVCIAFRAGMTAAAVGNSLERRTFPAKCWSATVTRQSRLDDECELASLSKRLVYFDGHWFRLPL